MTMPTPTDERDWEGIDAGHRAVDALQNIIGELRGTLDHDPDALGELKTALGVLLNDQNVPALGHPVIVADDADRLADALHAAVTAARNLTD